MVDSLLLSDGIDSSLFAKICLNSPSYGRKVIHTTLDHLAKRYLARPGVGDETNSPTISAVAAVIAAVVSKSEALRDELIKWCTSASGAGLGHGIGIRRAVIAVIAQSKEAITTVLEKSVSQFGDELYIRHAAILQQNGNPPFAIVKCRC